MYSCGVYYFPAIRNVSACPVNSTSSLYKPPPSAFELALELYLISFLCVLGICGNILSVIVLRYDRDRRDTLFLLQVLACADTLYLLVVILRYPVKFLVHDSSALAHMSLVVFPLHQTAQTITIWTMVLVSMDRYIYVCHPLRAPLLTGYKCRRLASATIFLLGLMYNTPLFLDSCLMTVHDLCTGNKFVRKIYRTVFNNASYYNIYRHGCTLAIMYLGPLLLLIITTCQMIKVIKKSIKFVRSSTRMNTSAYSDNNASFTLIIIILVFMVCETPELIFRILTITARYSPKVNELFTQTVIYKFGTISELFSVINSSMNFFIYCVFSRRFQSSLRRMCSRREGAGNVNTHELMALRETSNSLKNGSRRTNGTVVYA